MKPQTYLIFVSLVSITFTQPKIEREIVKGTTEPDLFSMDLQ